MTPAQKALLAFEEAHPTPYAKKPEDIREQLGLSHARYVQRLMLLLDDPEAEAEHPMLIHRLRRIRDERIEHRNARTRLRQVGAGG